MTLILPAVPSIAAFLTKKNQRLKSVLKHFPGIQLISHLTWLIKLSKLHIEICNDKLMLKQLKKDEDDTLEERFKEDPYYREWLKTTPLRNFDADNQKPSQVKWLKEKIGKNVTEVFELKTELQRFKIYAGMLESAPQVVLQLSICMKKIYNGEGYNLYGPLTLLQIISSSISVFFTITGLITDMPFYVWKTERPPIRNLKFSYMKVLPLVMLYVTPRFMAMVAISSFVTLEDWTFYLCFGGVYTGLFTLLCYMIERWVKKKEIPTTRTGLIKLGLFTALISPSVIGIFNSWFLLITSVSTSILQSLALSSLCAIGIVYPSLVFNSTHVMMNSTIRGSDMDLEVKYPYPEQTYLGWYTLILVPLLFLSNLVYYFISYLVRNENKFYIPVLAIDKNDKKLFKKGVMHDKFDPNAVVPSDDDQNSILLYSCGTHDEMSAHMIEELDNNLDLTCVNIQEKTPLIVCCEKSFVTSVKALFKKAVEGKDIAINQKAKYKDETQGGWIMGTALHFAIMSEGSIEDKRQIIKIFFEHAKVIEIDFLMKNDLGKTPLEVLEENQETVEIIQDIYAKFGNPIEEYQLLEHALKRNDLEGFNKVLTERKFAFLTLNYLLFSTIEWNEKFALKLIQNSKDLDLSLSQKSNDERRITPLILACSLQKLTIVKVLLNEAKDKIDIGINEKHSFGLNAFMEASKGGSIEIVNLMIELEQDTGVDLNAQDWEGDTAFHWACYQNHKEVVDLFVDKARDHNIDLSIKNKDKKTGNDIKPSLFETVAKYG